MELVSSAARLPSLQILDLASLRAHEWYDAQRTPPLIERMLRSGVFRNPPIVSPMQDGSGRFIIMDGANRAAALRALGSTCILAQVVLPGDPGLHLRTWNHALLDMPRAGLLPRLRQIAGLDLAGSDEPYIDLPASRREMGVALLQAPEGSAYALSALAEALAGRIRALNAVVDAYKSEARLERTTFSDAPALQELYPELSALVIFPKFDLRDLGQIVAADCLLPPGITRTTISPRALQVNYPLDELLRPEGLEARNRHLQVFLQHRMTQAGVVYCEEPTFFFDE
jgi:hypothetical protein